MPCQFIGATDGTTRRAGALVTNERNPHMIENYRRAIRHQAKRRLEPHRQSELQAAARAKHEAEQAEREVYLVSLVVKESEPISQNPLQARSRLRPIPLSKPKRVSRVATARATNQPATQSKEKL